MDATVGPRHACCAKSSAPVEAAEPRLVLVPCQPVSLAQVHLTCGAILDGLLAVLLVRVILINLLTDVLYGLVDPRIRYA